MKSKKSFFRTVEPYLYLIPVMILFILFVFWPFVKTIQLSFARTTSWSGGTVCRARQLYEYFYRWNVP